MRTTTENEVSPIVELDAREFGLHLKEGGWRLGLLVARSVEPGEGTGSSAIAEDERPQLAEGRKISAKRFADLAGTSDTRVMRYYRAWERYAAKGRVKPATQLEPGEEPDLDWTRLPKWSLSELPPQPGATGRLNLHFQLGRFGGKLAKAHRGLRTFVLEELPEVKKPGKDVRELAGRYATCLESDAALLRLIESGSELPDDLEDRLDLSHYFEVER